MSILIKDLEKNSELDAQAMANLVGGAGGYTGVRSSRYMRKQCQRVTVKYGNHKYKQCKLSIG